MSFLYFIFAIITAFFIPGHLFVRKLKLDLLSEITLSFITGFVLWSLLGFVLGYTHLRNLFYPYLFVNFVLWIKQKHYLFLKPPFPLHIDFRITIIIIAGVLIQLSSIWANGIKMEDGIYFCCGIPDTLTHLSLIQELVVRMPPDEPGFANIPLYNYHYLTNLAVADLVRIFRLPLVATQYQYLTVIWSILLGFGALTLAKQLRMDKRYSMWLVFFLYFAGDILFLLPVITGGNVQFSLTTLENASSLWVSPPRFIALVVFFGGLSVFVYWLKKRTLFSGMLMALIMGSLIGIKVYIGLLALIGFACLALYFFIVKKYSRPLPIIFMFLISLALFLPVNNQAGGLVFAGFWRFEDFIVQPVLGLSRLELARRVYLENFNYIKVIAYDLLFAFLYIVFSCGTLLIGLIQTKRSTQKIPKEFAIVTITGLIGTSIAGFFFLQNTGGANSSQFLISIYAIGTIYAALAVRHWKPFLPLSMLIIVLTSGRVTYSTIHHIQKIQHHAGVFIPQTELAGYSFFTGTDKNAIILMYEDAALDCLYVTFLGNRPTYSCTAGLPGVISDDVVSTRRNVKQTIFFSTDITKARNELRQNGITHIYIPKEKVRDTNIDELCLPLVFQTPRVAIYAVNN
jgi:hypothetical protein